MQANPTHDFDPLAKVPRKRCIPRRDEGAFQRFVRTAGVGMNKATADKRGKVLTHTMTNASERTRGSLCVPADKLNELYEAVIADVRAGVPVFINEIATPIFRMYFDVDFKVTRERSETFDVDAVALLIQETVRLFFDEDYLRDHGQVLRLLVCARPVEDVAAPPPEVPALYGLDALLDAPDGKEEATVPDAPLRSHGYHMVMPDLVVDNVAARTIHLAIVDRLRETPVHAFEGLDLHRVVDPDVYRAKASSLRLVGTDKCKPCGACKNGEKARTTCRSCDREGHQNVGRRYDLVSAFDGDGNRDERELETLRRNAYRKVWACSIRTTHSKMNAAWRPYYGCPTPPPEEHVAPTVSDKRKRGSSSTEGAAATKRGRKDNATDEPEAYEDVPGGDPISYATIKFLRESFDPAHYGELDLGKVSTSTSRRFYTVFVRGAGSRHCANLGGEHTSVNVYFSITFRGGCVQRCTCKCDTTKGRVARVPCKQFSSSPVEITDEMKKLMFPAQHAAEVERKLRVFPNPQVEPAQADQFVCRMILRLQGVASGAGASS